MANAKTTEMSQESKGYKYISANEITGFEMTFPFSENMTFHKVKIVNLKGKEELVKHKKFYCEHTCLANSSSHVCFKAQGSIHITAFDTYQLLTHHRLLKPN